MVGRTSAFANGEDGGGKNGRGRRCKPGFMQAMGCMGSAHGVCVAREVPPIVDLKQGYAMESIGVRRPWGASINKSMVRTPTDRQKRFTTSTDMHLEKMERNGKSFL